MLTLESEKLRHQFGWKRSCSVIALSHPLGLEGNVTCAGLEAKFAATTWGKKMQKRKDKASMNDLERYKAMVAKAARGRKIRKVFNSLRKSAAV
jgi:hypothetical protein